MEAKPSVNDTVRTLVDLPDVGLRQGAIGVVVAEFSLPDEAYEIEFCDENGEALAQVPLRLGQFEVIQV